MEKGEIISRRTMLVGILATPLIVRAVSLMQIQSMNVPQKKLYQYRTRFFHSSNEEIGSGETRAWSLFDVVRAEMTRVGGLGDERFVVRQAHPISMVVTRLDVPVPESSNFAIVNTGRSPAQRWPHDHPLDDTTS